jgi:CoA:oxalate CoA-transferase
MTIPEGPLAGYVVMDFTHTLAGPFCTQMLADAGATVIKVEPPGGEYSRIRGPKRTDDHGNSLSSYCACANRNKRSICIDLKNPEGLRIAKRFIAQADVLVENFAPGAFDRLGLGLAELRRDRPELVTCSISLFGGFDTAGENARRGGLAIVAEAESSVGGMQRDKDGSPVRLGFPLGDMGSGLAAYGAIVTALLARERTGLGRHIDISMVKTLLSFNSIAITGEQILFGGPIELHELRTAGFAIFPAADGFVAVAVNTDSLFNRLAAAIGASWMTTDPRFAHYVERDQHVDEVNELITNWTSSRTANDVVAAITPVGVPCGVVASPRDILDSNLIAELGFLEAVRDGMGGTIQVPANCIGYAQPDPAIPLLHEHGAELMAERIGVRGEEYDRLLKAGAFGSVFGGTEAAPIIADKRESEPK